MSTPPVIESAERAHARLFWRALGAYALAVVCLWSIGDSLERRFLVRGILLTSLLFYAAPAGVFLLWNWRELDERPFHLPGLAAALWTWVLAVSVAVIIKAAEVWMRVTLGLPVPVGVLLWPLLFALAFSVPLCMELLFRPVLQRTFALCWRPATALWGTSLLCALTSGDLARMPEMLALGFCGGVVFLRTGNYWACVLFQVTTTTLGLLQWRYLPLLAPLFNPISVLAFTAVAVFAAWRIQPPPKRRAGALANLRWAFFGHANSDAPPQRAIPGLALGYWAVAAVLGILVGGAAAAQLARLSPSKPAPIVKQSDFWRIGTNSMVLVASLIEFERWPEKRESLSFALPYTQARLLQAEVADGAVKTRSVGAGTFEIVWPDTLPAPPGRVGVLWEMPLDAVDDPAQGYRARLESMLPVNTYALRVRLEPGCGLEFEATPERREADVFSMQSTGPKPRNNFGTCGLGLQRDGAPVPTEK